MRIILNYIKQNKKILLIIVTLIIAVLIGYYYTKEKSEYKVSSYLENNIINESKTNQVVNNIDQEESKEEDSKQNKIIVHISGAVAKEGIIEVEEDSRISDIIDKAGGLLENSNLDEINLAYKVEDGMKIHIPTNEEINKNEEVEVSDNQYLYSEKKESKEEIINKKININTATEQELDQLKGIGQSTANKIIKYREENGKFKNIEDIKNVSGIGDAKFDGIRDEITV